MSYSFLITLDLDLSIYHKEGTVQKAILTSPVCGIDYLPQNKYTAVFMEVYVPCSNFLKQLTSLCNWIVVTTKSDA